MITLKIFYFLFGLLFFVCYFFRGQYFKYVLSINESKFGAFAGITCLFGVFINLLVSFIADKYQTHTSFLLILSILSSTVFTVILLNPEYFSMHHTMAVLFMGVYVLLASAMWSLVDRIVLQSLSKSGYSKNHFSAQRLFGNMGYFVITLGMGYIISIMGYTKGLLFGVSIICPLFIAYVVLWRSGIFLYFSSFFGRQHTLTNPNDKLEPLKESSTNLTNINEASFPPGFPDRPVDLKELFSLSIYRTYLFSLLVDGFTRFFLGFFINLYFTEEVGMSIRKATATVSFGIIVEMMFYALGAPALKYLGVYSMLAIGQLIMSIRLWLLFLIPPTARYEIFFVLELSRGAIGGLIHPASVALSSRLSPKGKESTCQALFNCVYTGLGGFLAGMFGSFFLGYLKTNGSISSFRFMIMGVAIISSMWCICFILIYRTWLKSPLNY